MKSDSAFRILNLALSSLFFATVHAAAAHAAVLQFPAQKAQLFNHSNLPNDAFQVSYSVGCRTVQGDDCGDFETEVPVQADGSYEIPAFALDLGKSKAADRRYSLFVFFSLPEDSPDFPTGIAPAGLASMVNPRGLTDPAQLAPPNFTVFKIAAGTLDLALESGADVESFLKGPGRDVGVDIEIDFSGTKSGELDQTLNLEQSGFSRKRWVDVPAGYFTIAGAYARNTPVDFEISWNYKVVKSGRAAFSSDVAQMLGSFTIDDRIGDQRVDERRLTGSFGDSYFDLDYAKREEYKFAEIGFSYATLNAECMNGKIQGELIYRSGQFEDEPETSRVPVRGTCAGETGEIQWPIEKKSGGTEWLSAKFIRIRAMDIERPNGQKKLTRLLMTDDVRESLGDYKGEELSMFLAVYAADGSYAGKLSVSTGK